MDNNIKEVKRPANDGEYIKIVDSIETDYKNGDIFKVVTCDKDDVYINMFRKGTGDNILVLYEEYVVLEGYDEKNKGCDTIDTPDNVELVVPINNPSTCDLQIELYKKIMKGNDDMNKVLKLYYERKQFDITEKYDDKVEEDFNNIEIVKKYKELVEKFEKDMKDLFSTKENIENNYIIDKNESNTYGYILDETAIKDIFYQKYIDEQIEETRVLQDLVDEVDAQLSLSDDLGYQIEVLSNYGIIDKKSGNKLKA